MAKKPSVGLGIDRMFDATSAPANPRNGANPLDVGTWQFGSRSPQQEKDRLNGNPSVPEAYKPLVGPKGNC